MCHPGAFSHPRDHPSPSSPVRNLPPLSSGLQGRPGHRTGPVYISKVPMGGTQDLQEYCMAPIPSQGVRRPAMPTGAVAMRPCESQSLHTVGIPNTHATTCGHPHS
mmetsp:Transcript_154143/g.269638  ORF Transcript_154143/g.269638 Transcript_154143/m.269638 type:complete len:106 (-) Transcript_154143:445-762(-)